MKALRWSPGCLSRISSFLDGGAGCPRGGQVFPSLAKYLGERKLYLRDENGQVLKNHLKPPGRHALPGVGNFSDANEARGERTFPFYIFS